MVNNLEFIESVCERIKSSLELECEINPDIPLNEQISQFDSGDLFQILSGYGFKMNQLVHAENLTEEAKAAVRYALRNNTNIEKRVGRDIDLRDVLKYVNARHISEAVDYLKTLEYHKATSEPTEPDLATA